VIETVGLTKRFGDTMALDSLDLRIEAGEVFGFLGPNGAGKTTTIRLLLGLIRPSSGEARLFGRDAWSEPVEIHREAIAAARPTHLTSREPSLEDLFLAHYGAED